MRSVTTAIGAAAVVLCMAGATHAEENNVAPKGFTALFNGTDLAGFWGAETEDPAKYLALPGADLAAKKTKSLDDIKKHWKVEKGELVNDGHGLYATTDKNYGDFELLVDYKAMPLGDSGIYLRGYPQVQIWDSTEKAKFGIGADKGSGGLWNNSPGAKGKDPLVLADKPFGEWNHFRIFMAGEVVTVYLNDKLVVDHAKLENYYNRGHELVKAGPIQLQTHGNEIRWRNIYLRPIGEEESKKIQAEASGSKAGEGEKGKAGAAGDDKDKGFVSIFNGKDFDGWAGPTENYEVKDGAILCKAGKGGTIHTKQEYSDFEVKLEFKLPPGGNNGLAIRYPGEGDTAYVGMCELQILDDTAEQYKTLDPRQYCGSIYGVVPAERGHLKPLGEWNDEHVIVKGSTIKVFLNGAKVIDADVSTVKEFMHNSPHPGLTRTKGSFGFAGHSDPVQFRNIRIKPLE
jgi:hypothetical protein